MPDFSIRILWEPVEIPGIEIPCCHVAGQEGKYAIACNGIVFSTSVRGRHGASSPWSGQWRPRRLQQMAEGHLRASLDRHVLVHHLVLEAFKGPRPDCLHECRHLDGDPQNNWWWNLQWGTRQENANDRIAHGRSCRRELSPLAVLTTAIVSEARVRKAQGERIEDIAASLNCKISTLYQAVAGLSWSSLVDPPPVPSTKRKPFPPSVREAVLRMSSEGRSPADVAVECGVPIAYVYERRRSRNS